ncbi:MAG: dTDP-4-dehydrorhamnose reductase [Epsilonproteobacteria bacterium]|nr:dTDP-4-dehydrorhamnose reductase [Campylobacterota bacterium]
MKILVTGSNGQLGSELQHLSSPHQFYFTTENELDITNYSNLRSFFNTHPIDMVINAAAYTAVDKAETQKELAKEVNFKGVEYLASLCKEKDIPLIHISTDYVFDGRNYRPYTEEDKVNPINNYGESKLLGEQAFKESGARGVILRTSWVYSSFGHNFVKTMLRLKRKEELRVVFDQIGSPTYARDLAKTILDLVDKDINTFKAEIFNYSNEGVCSWFDFAKAIFEMEKAKIKLNPILTSQYPTPAKRPHYSVLDKSKIKNTFDLEIPYWRDSLKQCLQRIKDNG